MSNQATMNFDQALPYLRRGFILRIHGAEQYDKGQLREEGGKLQFSKGDSQWGSAADLPLLDLSFDVYDQKKSEYVDYTKPLVERDAEALAKAQQLATAKAGQELGPTEGNDGRGTKQAVDEAEEELQLEALRILEENGERNPTDEQVKDMVLQLRQKADALNPVSEQAGGNTPPPSDPKGLQSLTQGFNEQQTDQVEPQEVAGGFGAAPIDEERIFDDSGEHEGGLPDEPTQVADGSDDGKKHKRGKRH